MINRPIWCECNLCCNKITKMTCGDAKLYKIYSEKINTNEMANKFQHFGLYLLNWSVNKITVNFYHKIHICIDCSGNQ